MPPPTLLQSFFSKEEKTTHPLGVEAAQHAWPHQAGRPTALTLVEMRASSLGASWSDELHRGDGRKLGHKPPKPELRGSESENTVTSTGKHRPAPRGQQHAAQWKVRVPGLLYKVQGKMCLKVLKLKAFSFSGISFSTCHGVFHLLFTVILNKEKR